MALAAVAAAASLPATQELTSARFVAPDAADPAGETVRLPHYWRNRSSAPVTARYRLQFDVPAGVTEFAVRIAGTNYPFEAMVNGRHAHENGGPMSPPVPLSSWRGAPTFRIPVDLLRPGSNELELLVFASRPGIYALGQFSVGTGQEIAALELRGWLLHNVLPLVIAATLGVVGLLSLALWRGRGDYAPAFWLGAGTLLWSVQNILIQLPIRILPPPHFGVLYISLYAWYPLILSIFFLRFAEQRSVLFERIALGVMALAMPLLYAAEAAGHFNLGSAVLRGLVLVFILIALAAVFRYALRTRGVKGKLLFAAGALCVGGALHDYALSFTDPGVQPVYLTTYAGVVLVLLAAWMLLDRYQQTYSAYRDLNVELERRVQDANAELRGQLAQTQAAREQAEQASVAKSRFFAAASHDLRQPLHSAALFTSALEEHLSSPQAQETARGIRESIAALESLFDALLDLSRLDAGIVAAQPRNVALQALFDRLARQFHVEAVERELRLRFVPTRAVVRTDPLLLERILTNLVANALRYTRRGGVAVGVRRRGGCAAITVCDTGIGIPADKQALVFDEFYQIGNPGRDRRLGLGLGLSIVRRLAGLLEHPLSLRSVPGRGTCFSLLVPAADGPADAPVEPAAGIDDEALRDVRVLVVDDDLMVRDGTSALLRQWRAQPRTAASAAEAERAIDEGFDPQLLIVDLRLGEAADGIDVVEALRLKQGRPIPALLVSGDTGALELMRVRYSGIPFLTKPVAPAKLRGLLRGLLDADAAQATARG
jgi:signal transduction histidine kinase